MAAFEGVDYYALDGLLNDEQKLVRDTVREFVSDKILPIIDEHQRDGTFPVETLPGLAAMGLLGANLEGYGLPGLDNISYGLILQELERGDSGLRSFVSVQGALCMYPIWRYGSEAQKQQWLPAMGKGDIIACFGLTEPDAGSDPGAMSTCAELDGDEWVLNGVKYWITNGTIAQLAIVWAKTDKGIRGFLVPTNTPGFSANKVTGKYSLRVSDTAELVLQDCRISADNVLPDAEGLKGPLTCLNQARYGIAWGAVGAAMACYDEALRYAKNRIAFGRPVAATQLIQELLVECVTEITKAQLMCLRLGQLKEAGTVTPQQVSMAKRNNVLMALNTARTCREILGANGILDDYQSFRHMVNLESVYTYEGTHQIHTLIVGHDITGYPAFGEH
ncbi:MAG TPA: acyl-CoA dehydrogenase family protein [Acidobacteriota bacterium]|nr:acyl-CoA dehydrogenase [Acidobacteriota bacterium]MEC8943871.1 acyl-CoA dehydrogenase family protein [Acidobacteriota bacterium]HJO29629.1 acyl-CoA dehydrogenase family protein [Acidobacteriota bacterium]|tara:strand:- start:1440 stop:2612 length:1173 start_codon:yes stop_codon:yes gene_type:complete